MKVPALQEPDSVGEAAMGEFTDHSGARSQGRCRRPCQSRRPRRLSSDREPVRRGRRPLRHRARPVSHTASPSLYIADLDAIAGIGNHFELVRGLSYALPGTTLWIDAGFSDVADCAFWLPLGATLVIGSESLAGVDDWREIHAAFGEGVVLSLDFDAEGRQRSRARCSTIPRSGPSASSP